MERHRGQMEAAQEGLRAQPLEIKFRDGGDVCTQMEGHSVAGTWEEVRTPRM